MSTEQTDEPKNGRIETLGSSLIEPSASSVADDATTPPRVETRGGAPKQQPSDGRRTRFWFISLLRRLALRAGEPKQGDHRYGDVDSKGSQTDGPGAANAFNGPPLSWVCGRWRVDLVSRRGGGKNESPPLCGLGQPRASAHALLLAVDGALCPACWHQLLAFGVSYRSADLRRLALPWLTPPIPNKHPQARVCCWGGPTTQQQAAPRRHCLAERRRLHSGKWKVDWGCS